jgi:hypothetical protein
VGSRRVEDELSGSEEQPGSGAPGVRRSARLFVEAKV